MVSSTDPAATLRLSMDEVKVKLKSLRELVPGQLDPFYDFAAFLADRLNPELVPMGFALACELALEDLRRGVDGFTSKPIRSRLVGYPPMVYSLMRMDFGRIAEATCPPDFAAAVKSFIAEVNADMAKDRAKA